jgi:hypothetical protein
MLSIHPTVVTPVVFAWRMGRPGRYLACDSGLVLVVLGSRAACAALGGDAFDRRRSHNTA